MDPKCCCGATKSKPCACMKQEITNKCSNKEPKCPCFTAIDKKKEVKKAFECVNFEKSWEIVKRKLPYCPYCDGNLSLADGQWNSKYCTTPSCKRNNPVSPYYAPEKW